MLNIKEERMILYSVVVLCQIFKYPIFIQYLKLNSFENPTQDLENGLKNIADILSLYFTVYFK